MGGRYEGGAAGGLEMMFLTWESEGRLDKAGKAFPQSLRRGVWIKKSRKGTVVGSACAESELSTRHGAYEKWNDFPCGWVASVSGEVRTETGGQKRAVIACIP